MGMGQVLFNSLVDWYYGQIMKRGLNIIENIRLATLLDVPHHPIVKLVPKVHLDGGIHEFSSQDLHF